MIFAHAFIGAIIAYFYVNQAQKYSKTSFKTNKKRLVWITAIIASIFPDIDILYVLLIDNSIQHRTLLTHSIVPYTILAIAIICIIKFTQKDKFWISLTILAWIGILLHLIADLYIAPVYLFAPIIKTEFLWKPFPIDLHMGLKAYLFSPYMLTEIVIMITGTILVIKSFVNEKKELIILLSLLGMIIASAILTLIPFIHSFNK